MEALAKVPNLRGVGDVLAVDPHKKMLKKSKRLAKNVEGLADIVEQSMKYETWEIDKKDE